MSDVAAHAPVSRGLGDGLGVTQRFVAEVVAPLFRMDEDLEDGCRITIPASPYGTVLTTDLFTVDPIEFPGGDLGKLAASGVINDLLASGARPAFLTLDVLASETLDREVLARCLESLARYVNGHGARIVCGDTKTHPFREPALSLALTGVGVPISERTLALADAQPGDDLWITGPLGGHSIAVLSAREGLGFENVVESDCAPLLGPLGKLVERGWVHAMRDLTRGGLLAAAHDGVRATGRVWHFRDADIPVLTPVRAAAEMLGLDPLALANEGSMLLAAPAEWRTQIASHLARFEETAAGARVGFIGMTNADIPEIELESGEVRLMLLPDSLGIPRLC